MSENLNEIIFLGTGTSQGVPAIGCNHPVCLSKNPKDKRLRASILLSINNKKILIDCGPDFRQQMLRENQNHVDAVLLTHEHNDHIIGLDDLRPIYFKNKIEPKIYSLPRILNEIKNRFPYAFSEIKYPGVPAFDLYPIKANEVFWIDGIPIIPLKIWHGKLEILGFRIGRLAYLTDLKNIPEETLPLLQNLEVLIIDALRIEREHHSHLTLQEAITYAQKLKPQKTYFTHMSYEIGFHEETEKTLPKNMHLAYDGLKLKFNLD